MAAIRVPATAPVVLVLTKIIDGQRKRPRTAVLPKNIDGGHINTPGQPTAAALALAAVTVRQVSRLRV